MPDYLEQLNIGPRKKGRGSLLSQLGLEEKVPGEVLSPLLPRPTLTEERLKTMELEGIPVGGPMARMLRPTGVPALPFGGFLTEPVEGPAAVPIDIAEAILHLGKGALGYIPSKLEAIERLAVGTAAGLSAEDLRAEVEKAGAWLGAPGTPIAEAIGKVVEPVFAAPMKAVEEPPISIYAAWARAWGEKTRAERRAAGLPIKEPPIPRSVMRKVDVWTDTIVGTALELGMFKLIGDIIRKVKPKKEAKITVEEVQKVAKELEQDPAFPSEAEIKARLLAKKDRKPAEIIPTAEELAELRKQGVADSILEIIAPKKKAPVKRAAKIPAFKTPEEAIDFGSRATPEQVKRMEKLRREHIKKSGELRAEDKADEAWPHAMNAQYLKEAIDASTGDLVRGKLKPTEVAPTDFELAAIESHLATPGAELKRALAKAREEKIMPEGVEVKVVSPEFMEAKIEGGYEVTAGAAYDTGNLIVISADANYSILVHELTHIAQARRGEIFTPETMRRLEAEAYKEAAVEPTKLREKVYDPATGDVLTDFRIKEGPGPHEIDVTMLKGTDLLKYGKYIPAGVWRTMKGKQTIQANWLIEGYNPKTKKWQWIDTATDRAEAQTLLNNWKGYMRPKPPKPTKPEVAAEPTPPKVEPISEVVKSSEEGLAGVKKFTGELPSKAKEYWKQESWMAVELDSGEIYYSPTLTTHAELVRLGNIDPGRVKTAGVISREEGYTTAYLGKPDMAVKEIVTEPRPPVEPPKISDRIRALFEEGKDAPEIAKAVKMSEEVVAMALTEMKLSRGKKTVTMRQVEAEAKAIMEKAKDLDEVHTKMQELTTRYEENIDAGFADNFELQRYRDWGDELIGKIVDTRRKAGLVPEPDPDAPISVVTKEGVRETFTDPTDKGGFSTRKVAETYRNLNPEVGEVVENPNAPRQFVFRARPTDVTLGMGGFQQMLEDAGFFKREIEKGVSARGIEDAKAGKVFWGSEMVPVTEKMIEGKRRAVNEALRKVEYAEKGLPKYTEELIGTAEADKFLEVDTPIYRKSDVLPELRRRLKDAEWGLDRYERQMARAKGEITLETGGFQQMYEALADRLKRRAGEKLTPEVREVLDKGKIIKQRKVKGRIYPPVYEAQLEILKGTRKLDQTMFHRGFENPIRTFEDAGGQALLDMTIHEYHAREFAINKMIKKFRKDRKEIGKGLKRKERERIMIHAIASEKGGAVKLDLMGIKAKDYPKLTPREKTAYDALRARYEAWYTRLNRVRKAIGKEPFPYTENYFTFIRDLSWLERIEARPMDMPADILNAHFIKMGATPFRFAKPRSNARYRLEMDPFHVLEIYEDSAIRHIQLSPLIAQMRELQLSITDPVSGKAFLLRNENPVLAAALHSWNNHIAGMKSPTFKLPPGVESAMMRINSNLAASILGANARSAMIQVSALRNTVAEIGFEYSMRGVMSLIDPAKRNFAMRKSKVLAQRVYEITVEDALRSVRAGRVGEVQRIGAKAALKPLQILDLETAKACWQGSYEYAKGPLKFSESRARIYADDVVTRTQASAMPGDIAPIQRAVAGKFLTLFQTFTINDWNFFVKDVMRIGREGPMSKPAFKNAMRFVAATTLFNMLMEDVLKIQSPFPTPIRAFRESLERGDDIPSLAWNVGKEFIEPIPIIGAARYGKGPFGPGGELLVESVDFIRRDPMAREWWELSGKWLGIPGTAQIGKSVRARKRGESLYGQVVGTYTRPEPAMRELEGLEGLETMQLGP